jgi:hypothetical protein
MKNEGIVATVDITKEQWDQLDSWARIEHVPLQTLINTVFNAGFVIFEHADARAEDVRTVLDDIRQQTKEICNETQVEDQ